jgi:competence protein ComEA
MIGRATLAGAASSPTAPHVEARALSTIVAPSVLASPPVPEVSATATAIAMASASAAPPVHRGPATPDDPVVLNDATTEDLQRLPGIGAKRADAIIALRTRLGRFHQIEDLLKVRGIGLRMLSRLRPLVILDAPTPPSSPDAG